MFVTTVREDSRGCVTCGSACVIFRNVVVRSARAIRRSCLSSRFMLWRGRWNPKCLHRAVKLIRPTLSTQSVQNGHQCCRSINRTRDILQFIRFQMYKPLIGLPHSSTRQILTIRTLTSNYQSSSTAVNCLRLILLDKIPWPSYMSLSSLGNKLFNFHALYVLQILH